MCHTPEIFKLTILGIVYEKNWTFSAKIVTILKMIIIDSQTGTYLVVDSIYLSVLVLYLTAHVNRHVSQITQNATDTQKILFHFVLSRVVGYSLYIKKTFMKTFKTSISNSRNSVCMFFLTWSRAYSTVLETRTFGSVSINFIYWVAGAFDWLYWHWLIAWFVGCFLVSQDMLKLSIRCN